MKLPRWVIAALLSASILAIVAVPVWYWAEWPRATARQFIQLIAEGRLDEARCLMRDKGEFSVFLYYAQSDADFLRRVKDSQNDIEFKRRSVMDVLAGRDQFTVTGNYAMNVERGIVFDEAQAPMWSVVPYFR